MTSDKRKPEARVLLLITTPTLARKAAALLDGYHVPLQYQFHGQGTASSEILETLGLGSIEKILLLCALPRALADQVLGRLRMLRYPQLTSTTAERGERGSRKGMPKYSVRESTRFRAMASRLFLTQAASSGLSW